MAACALLGVRSSEKLGLSWDGHATVASHLAGVLLEKCLSPGGEEIIKVVLNE